MRQEGPVLAKQTIPNAVIVIGGMSQVCFDFSSLQGTQEFRL